MAGRRASPPQSIMADDSIGDHLTDVHQETDGLAAQADTLPVAPEGEPQEPDASTPASTGKRPAEEDAFEKDGDDDGDEDEARPRKKARTDPTTAGESRENSSDGADDVEGDSEVSSKEGATSSPGEQDAAPSAGQASTAAAPAPGLGLRTSFGGSPHNLTQTANPDMLMHSPLTAEQRNLLVTAVRAGESRQVSAVKKRDMKWTVNPLSTDWVVGVTWLEVFESMLDKWCEAFLVENQKNIDEVGLAPTLLKQAFMRRLGSDVAPNLPGPMISIANRQLKNPDASRLRTFASEFKPNPKKAAKRAAKKQAQLEKQTGQTNPQQQQQQVTSAASTSATASSTPVDTLTTKEKTDAETDHSEPKPDQAQQHLELEAEKEEGEVESGSGDANEIDMEIVQDGSESPIAQAELDQRHRYFPELSDDTKFCLSCAQSGHTTTRCPEAICKYCQGDHFKYECPTRQRCGKCKQLGHTKGSCPEKLAVAQGEVVMECAICGLHDHTEANCSELWETYRPQPGHVQKVRSLPTFCYCCGSDNHLGGDCGLATRDIPPTRTWTVSTASLYIDPLSSNDALVYRHPLPPPADMSAPVIPGRSIKPQSHIIFESDDSGAEADGAGFLRAPIAGSSRRNQSQQQGGGSKIAIKSNINFGAAPAGLSSNQPQNQNASSRYPRHPRSSQAPARNGRDFPLRDGGSAPTAGQGDSGTSKKKRSKARQQGQAQQQPPLPPGPPPSHSSNGSTRGRGGFSGLSRRGRSRRNGFK